ncbi:hypothetical protein LCGC14_0399410 [marine sediment metagenome]|uniref:Uncharacterized protein n=1 Tax=marine sediment metagenome TaxID=412755 RepID=A0A0F9SXG9_9ZZZZ
MPFGIDPNTLALSPGQVLTDEARRRQETLQREQMQKQFAIAQRRITAQQRATEMQRQARTQQYGLQRNIAEARIREQQAGRTSKEKMFGEAMEAERTGKMTKFSRDVYLRALSEGFMPEAESPSMMPGVEGMPSLVAPPTITEEQRAGLAGKAGLEPSGLTEKARLRYARPLKTRIEMTPREIKIWESKGWMQGPGKRWISPVKLKETFLDTLPPKERPKTFFGKLETNDVTWFIMQKMSTYEDLQDLMRNRKAYEKQGVNVRYILNYFRKE